MATAVSERLIQVDRLIQVVQKYSSEHGEKSILYYNI